MLFGDCDFLFFLFFLLSFLKAGAAIQKRQQARGQPSLHMPAGTINGTIHRKRKRELINLAGDASTETSFLVLISYDHVEALNPKQRSALNFDSFTPWLVQC